MNTVEKIYLSIFGNPVRSEGSKILLDGRCPFSMEYEGIQGINNVPYAFVVKTCERFTLFKLFCNRVTTSDGQMGTLIFAASVPKGYAIKGDKSPYDLLIDLRRAFIDRYMVATPGALEVESYMFRSIGGLIDEAEYTPILDAYPLVRQSMPHYPMVGVEQVALQLDGERIKIFFRDVNYYRELAEYKEVIVAYYVDNSYYPGRDLTESLEVPRKKRFTVKSAEPIDVFINNTLVVTHATQYTIDEDDFNSTITVTSTENPDYYNLESESFVINELLQGQTLNRVTMSVADETIRCSVKGREKEETIKLKLCLHAESLSDFDLTRHVRIFLGSQLLKIENGQFTLKGEQLGYVKSIKASIEEISGYGISGFSWSAENNQKIMVVELQPVQASMPAKTSRRGGIISDEDRQSQQKEITLKIKIRDINGFIKDKQVRIKLVSDVPRKKTPEIILIKQAEVKSVKNGGKEVELVIPSDWNGKRMKIFLETSKEKTDGTIVTLGINKEVTIDVSKITSLRTPIQKIEIICFFATPVMFACCLFLGYLYFYGRTNPDVEKYEEQLTYLEQQVEGWKLEYNQLEQDYKNLKNEGGNPTGSSDGTSKHHDSGEIENSHENDAQQQTFFESIVSMLAKSDLKFADVVAKYDKYSDSYANSTLTDSQEAIAKKLEAYHTVVDILMNGNEDKIKSLDADSRVLKLLKEEHRINVLAIYYGDFSKEIPELWKKEDVGVGGGRNARQGATNGLKWYIAQRNKEYVSFSKLSAFLTARAKQQGVR